MNTLDFYSIDKCKQIFDSVENPNWRVWKIKDFDGKSSQSRMFISKPEELWRFIHQSKNPKALYVSVSKFLNPQLTHGAFYKQNFKLFDGTHMFPREGYIFSDEIMLDTDLFIDMDSEEDLRIAQEDGRKIITYMQDKPEYQLNLLQYSARKGIHLGYKILNNPQIEDPIKRIEYYKELKGRLAKELIQLGLKTIDNHHIEVIKNNFCVFAAPYSIKDNGQIVTPLNRDIFMQEDIYNILRSKKPTRAFKRGNNPSEAKANEGEVAAVEGNTSTHQYRVVGRDSGISSQPIIFKFTDSMVNGLKNTYITVIKKHKGRFKVNELKKLQECQNLSDFIIVKIGDYVYSYCFKINDFGGQVKILSKAKSENFRYFINHRHLPIQVSESVYQNGEIANSIEFIGTLKSPYGTDDAHSLPHCKLFRLNYNNMVGREWSDKEPCHIGTMRVA